MWARFVHYRPLSENMQGQALALTEPPPNLSLATPSTPWSVIWRMLGMVMLIFTIANIVTFIAYGIIVNEPSLSVLSTICLAPLLLIYMMVRRPKLTHVLLATPSYEGNTKHLIDQNRMLSTPMPTKFEHHLIRDSPPLEMPKTYKLWALFILTIIIGAIGLAPMAFSDDPRWVVLALLIGIPAWLLGFSLPVHGWWAFSTRHLGLITTKRDGELMLVTGMLSTIPALLINSIAFPTVLKTIGIENFDSGSIGELLILAISAPVGEEICKALFVLSLYRIIDSPRRGFQVGFTVGLGFALLENLQYILFSLLGEGAFLSYSITSVIRGIGSIPGHAFWTGLSGVAIGWHLSKNKTRIKTQDDTSWVVIHSESGDIIQQQSNEFSKIKQWLNKPLEQTWTLPQKPIAGLLLAIMGHSFWNGSSWLISSLFADSSVLIQIIITLSWLMFLIGGLWYIGRQVLASVLHLPS